MKPLTMVKEELRLSPQNYQDKFIFVDTLFHYECDGSGGKFDFDGYYYLNDCDLPKHHNLFYRKTDEAGTVIVDQLYIVEVYRREEIADTSVYTPTRRQIEARGEVTTDEDDEYGGICFFPTKRQVIYFRVI